MSPDGARVELAGHVVTLRADSLKRSGSPQATPLDGAAQPLMHGAETRTERADGVYEWWRSLDHGLEHGITMRSRPPGDGLVTVTLRVDGDLTPRTVDTDAIAMVDSSGSRVATYGQLSVVDAEGRSLPARMRAAGSHIAITFDDEAARYPVVVDPLLYAVEEAILADPLGVAGDWFGFAVAISDDGTRVVVGAHRDDTVAGYNAGSARVFVRTGTSWSDEATLVALGGLPGDGFGRAVAISGDGTRILVGAPTDDTARGADAGTVRVFLRTGASWVEEATLADPNGAVSDQFGTALALSFDASRAVIGSPYEDTNAGPNAGTARVYVRVGTSWTEEALLVASQDRSDDQFGDSVAITPDGTRIAVGALYDTTPAGPSAGSVRMFARSGANWSEEATVLPSDGATFDNFGAAVSLSADGTRLLVGAFRDDTAAGADAGSARVFLRSGTSWTEEAVLLANDAFAGDWFGAEVSLSADGTRALVGAPFDFTTSGGAEAGSGRVFERSGTSWTEEAFLVASDGAPGEDFGQVLALSADGTRAAFGLFQDGTQAGGAEVGSARVFAIAPKTDLGTPCDIDEACTSGHCVDGVCCDDPCGDGAANDCLACVAALTGGADGTCAALSVAVAPTVTCRPSAGPCDVAEACDPTSVTCPAVDRFADASSVCRAASTVCDVDELCDGASATCPTDAVASAGATCRASAGACDLAESCDGATKTCPPDLRIPAGITCRQAVGTCDIEERCDGTSSACAADVVLAMGTLCRPAVSACDVTETCTGSTGVCPADVQRPDGAICDDAITCTLTSACQLGVCTATRTLDCSDGDPCTVDGCEEPLGCTSTRVPVCGLDAGMQSNGDASVDASRDGSAGDASEPTATPAAAGCSCRIARDRPGSGVWCAAAAGVALVRRRNRRRTRRA